MRKKTLWLAMNGLMALSLVFVACGPPSVTTTAPVQTAPSPSPPPSTQTTPAPAAPVSSAKQEAPTAETPKYGGVLTLLMQNDPTYWDEGFATVGASTPLTITNQELLTGDWARGPAGTGEFTWTATNNRFDTKVGALAEKWQILEPGHMVFEIRQGVRWALDPSNEASRLVGGRELSAEDVVQTIKRYTTLPTAFLRTSYPQMAASVNITAPDKRTVDIRVSAGLFYEATFLTENARIRPPEVINKYGDMRSWRVSVGTGPFMLTDYVSGSSITLMKNPNYWEKDPVGSGKGNQLPYLDGIRILIIPDQSTWVSALRTAKLDASTTYLELEDSKALIKSRPELRYNRYGADGSTALYMRLDKPELPFKDSRVRRALMMATDFNSIKNDLYGGEAELLTWPFAPIPEFINSYLPLKEAPESVQELWRYNPEKAKQLLTEAGYPRGFKTTVVSPNSANDIDRLSIIKAMWAKVGIDLAIDPKESAVYASIIGNRTHSEMILFTGALSGSQYIRLFSISGVVRTNASYVNDPRVEEVKTKLYDYFNAGNEAAIDKLTKELMKYVLDQAWVIPLPLPNRTVFWWPWLKNYHGEMTVGYNNTPDWVRYVWVDQNLKKSMGY